MNIDPIAIGSIFDIKSSTPPSGGWGVGLGGECYLSFQISNRFTRYQHPVAVKLAPQLAFAGGKLVGVQLVFS